MTEEDASNQVTGVVRPRGRLWPGVLAFAAAVGLVGAGAVLALSPGAPPPPACQKLCPGGVISYTFDSHCRTTGGGDGRAKAQAQLQAAQEAGCLCQLRVEDLGSTFAGQAAK